MTAHIILPVLVVEMSVERVVHQQAPINARRAAFIVPKDVMSTAFACGRLLLCLCTATFVTLASLNKQMQHVRVTGFLRRHTQMKRVDNNKNLPPTPSPRKNFCRESWSLNAGKKSKGNALSIARNSSKSIWPSELLGTQQRSKTARFKGGEGRGCMKSDGSIFIARFPQA